MSKKALTRTQIEGRKAKAVRFVDNVLGDPDRASEIEAESTDEYAERKGIKILDENPGPHPRRRSTLIVERSLVGGNMKNPVAGQTKEDLLARIRELEEENDDLQEQLDQVADIVAPEDGDGDDDEDDDGEEEED